MAKVSVYNIEGNVVGDMDLADQIFAAPVNEHLVHACVVNYLAAQRQGTQKAKTRSEVSGGGKKPYRQKGTGHARQGSTRAPQWTGGGVVFAPVPRDYHFKVNKKERRAALRAVLTQKLNEEKLVVVDEFKMDEIKTKTFAGIMEKLNAKNALLVLNEKDETVVRSARNYPTVKTAGTNTINVYDILKYDKFVVTKDAVNTIQEVYA
ncbi:MAG: 50S ribosomal protein L4 [Lachnospiraceae bacterium]|nr:50S ribosomal protein L4 [Lachnospiraceae bacterium]